jgi:hypothetical protein
MSLEEFLARVRTGNITISMHYDVLSGRVICRWGYFAGTPADVIAEITDVLRNHQGEIYWLVRNSDIRVCYDVIGHKPHHIPVIMMDDSESTICEECARIRELDKLDEGIAPVEL